jgi:phosphoglycerate dehydrogenase-like enzyme
MQLLLTERAFTSFGDRIIAVTPQAQLVRMQHDGSLLLGDETLEWQDARPDVAWLTADLFDNGPIRPFFKLALDSKPQWLHFSGAGTDHPVFQMLLDGGTRLTSSRVNSIPIAEYVVRAVLDHLQQPERWQAARGERRWEPHDFREVHGTSWLIVGLGSIGANVAVRAKAFGARVVGIRRSPTGDEPVDECATPDRLASIVPQADVVVLSLPGGQATRHLFDASMFSAMRKGSVLVNVGRGSLIDEDALHVALDRGVPEVAILDVIAEEPPPPRSWLWTHERVVLTPHSSAGGTGRYERAAQAFVDNLERWQRGEALRYEVTAADS